MSLTGPITLAIVIALAVAMPALALTCWNRVGAGGSRVAGLRRWAARSGLVVGSQLCAVALVAVMINDTDHFYTSWLELLGEHHTVTSPAALPGSEDATVLTALSHAHGQGAVVKIRIPGTTSGIGSFPALVYLPPQYAAAEYANRSFPVVELLAGAPGTPQTWTSALAIAHILDHEIAAGRSLPVVAIMPTEDVDGGRDTQCVNIVRGPQVDTYLTQDVRAAAVHSFRVRADAPAWAVMGYSSGGFCATNLAMRHPEMFSAAVSIAGYSRPAHDHQTGDLFHGDVGAMNANTPLWRASHLPLPEIALLLISSNQDPETAKDAKALAALARPPMSLTRIDLTHGGHNFEVWRAEEPVAFAWLSTHLVAPLAPAPTIDHLNPTVTGATH